MANRIGEFALVIEPGNEAHVVRANDVDWILTTLLSLIRSGLLALRDPASDSIEFLHTASPEFGSIKFNLLAAAAVVGAAGSTAEFTGVNLREIFIAASVLVFPQASAHPPEPDQRLMGDNGFRNNLNELVRVATASGYPSVKILTPDGYQIELTETRPPLSRDLTSEAARLENEIEQANAQRERLQHLLEATGDDRRAEVRSLLAEVNSQLLELQVRRAGLGVPPPLLKPSASPDEIWRGSDEEGCH